MQVDGAVADGAAAGHRDFRAAPLPDEGAEDADAGAHLGDEVVGGAAVLVADHLEGHLVAAAVDADAELLEDERHRLDVGEVGDAAEDELAFVEQQGCGHHGQGGVLRAADFDGASKRMPAFDDECVHSSPSALVVSYNS